MMPQSRHTTATAASLLILSFAAAQAEPRNLDEKCRVHGLGTVSRYDEGCRAFMAMLGASGPRVDQQDTRRALDLESPAISSRTLNELRKSRNGSL